MNAGRITGSLVAVDDVAPRDKDQIIASAVSRHRTLHPGHLRVLDAEGGCLADLPANQLLEVLRFGRHLLEADERDLGDRIRQQQGYAFRPR